MKHNMLVVMVVSSPVVLLKSDLNIKVCINNYCILHVHRVALNVKMDVTLILMYQLLCITRLKLHEDDIVIVKGKV